MSKPHGELDRSLPPPSGDGRAWALALLAAVLAFAVFIPALSNEFVNWDDKPVLLDITEWRGLGAEQIGWMFTTYHYGHYQPITWLTYGVDYLVWGMNPTGFHLTNNLFHAANTLLVYFVSLILLRRAFEGRATSLLHLGALLATLLFALHPLRVESVAWVTERRDLVSAFFLLLTVLTYLKAAAPGQTRRWVWLGVALGIYLISMVSKVGGAPLPVVLLVLDWYPLRRLGPTPRHWFNRTSLVVAMEKVPFLIIAVGLSIVTIVRQRGEWMIPLQHHDFIARVAQAFYGLAFYLAKTCVPSGLLPLYELRTPLDPLEPRFVVAAVFVVALAAAALLLWRRWPGVAAAGLCYAMMIGPLLGFFQNGPQLVADRYTYLSCLGWAILLAGAAVHWIDRTSAGRAISLGLAAAGVAALVTLSTLTWRQCRVWRDSVVLWGYVLERDPNCSYANNNYGALLLEADRNEDALPYLRKAVETSPKNYRAWYNLWGTLRRLGRSDELRLSYIEATGSPLVYIKARGHFGLGRLAYGAGDYQTALGHYGDALAMMRRQPLTMDEIREFAARTHNEYGVTLLRLGRAGEVEPYYRQAIQLNPQLPEPRLNLASVLQKRGQIDEAIRHIEAVLAVNPSHDGARTMLEGMRAGGVGATGRP